MADPSDSHLTIAQVAGELEMSSDGVYKLIRRGKLKAVRVSERKMYVSRLALDSYRRRLNGDGPDLQRPGSVEPLEELRAAFERETGYPTDQWIARWTRGEIEDSAENAELLVRALGLRAARTASSGRRTKANRSQRPPREAPRSRRRSDENASGIRAKQAGSKRQQGAGSKTSPR